MTRALDRTLRSTTSLRTAKFFEDSGLADRQVKVRCSAPAVDRYGEIVVQAGIDLGPFKMSPTVLWEHDTSFPIARAVWIGLESGNLTSVAQFPPLGTDETADRIYRLIKADVPLDVSIGFLPVEFEPIDPRNPYGPQRYLQCELLEWSFCAIGAQRDSRVIGKALRSAGTETAASRLARAKARAARLEGDEGLPRAHQWQPPPPPTPEQLQEQDHRQRCAAAMSWLAWW
jgi:hypothetical protein